MRGKIGQQKLSCSSGMVARGALSAKSVRSDSLARNSFAIMATTVVTAAFGGLFWLIAARSHTPSDVGFATALVSAMGAAALIADLGVRSALVQALPPRRSGRDWSVTVNAGLCASGVAGVILGCGAVWALPALSDHFASLTRHPFGSALLVGGVVTTVVATAADYVCVAERQAWKMFSRNLAFALVRLPLLAVLPLVAAAPGWEPLLGAWSVAMVISCLAALAVFLPRLGRGYTFAFRGIIEEMRRLSGLFLGHHLINLGGALPMFLLPLVVTARLSATSNAYFYVTWTLCSAFFLVSPAIAAALFAEGANDQTRWSDSVRRSAKFTAVLLGPPIVVFLLAGRWILAVFGDQYSRAGLGLLVLLVISAVPDAVTNIYITKLRVDRRLRIGAALNVGMGIAALVLSWFMLPPLGIAGAGAAWLTAQAFGTLFCVSDALIRRPQKAAA